MFGKYNAVFDFLPLYFPPFSRNAEPAAVVMTHSSFLLFDIQIEWFISFFVPSVHYRIQYSKIADIDFMYCCVPMSAIHCLQRNSLFLIIYNITNIFY